MNEEFLEQYEVGMLDEYNDELLSEGVEGMSEPIPQWFWFLLVGVCIVMGALLLGTQLGGGTRTVTKTVDRVVYVSDPGLSEKIDALTERLEKAEHPSDPDYRLCTWSDLDCEEGVDYVKKSPWED